MPPRRMTFQPGDVVVTAGLRAALDQTGEELDPYFIRYMHGDWGMISEEDRRINDEALLEDHGGGPLLGIYRLKDRTEFWIYTDAERDVTTALLPEEF